MGNIYSDRIEELRARMRAHDWDAVIITGSDPHSSEYPSERWKQVRWLSGFTGEAGDLVVTLDHAGLWTDTRYFIQANQQLAGTGVELHKTRVPDQVLIPEWLARTFPDGAFVAVDGLCQSAGAVAGLPSKLSVVSVPDLLGPLWKDRPAIPQTPVFTVDPGESREDKLEWMRSEIAARGCDCALLSGLDDIAWLLNVRASDIEYNPLVISYLIVSRDTAEWFVLKGEVEDDATARSFDGLRAAGVELRPYDDIALALGEDRGRMMIDSGTLNYHLSTLLGPDVLDCKSPVQLRKAVKNVEEIQGMKLAHLLDGIAMEQFLYWLEKGLQSGASITERDAAVRLGELRAEAVEYLGDSFETISAYGPGAALPHYITPMRDAPVLHRRGLYLCDSGGQYTCGTTDITRTVPLGPCSELEKEDYTLVLKGHIDLSMAVFPAGTAGCQLDALAREPLWKARRSFGHGTGHGVGYVLGVHEGPQDIRQNFNPQPLLPGMITSDEPGIYREGMHGVRHENLVLCVEDETNEFGSFLRFEPLTLCHFDTSILVGELLTKEELNWINEYNASVYRQLSPYLPGAVAEWLRIRTRAV